MFFEAGIERTSCFADLQFCATNHIYDVISLAVEVFRKIHGGTYKGHILHLSWLHRVVPGVWVIVCCSLNKHVTNICVSFICNQWWLANYFFHRCMCLQKTQFFRMMFHTQNVEGCYRRLKINQSSVAVTQLGCNICCRGISLTNSRAFLLCSWGSVYWWRSQSFHQPSPRNPHHPNTGGKVWGTGKMGNCFWY